MMIQMSSGLEQMEALELWIVLAVAADILQGVEYAVCIPRKDTSPINLQFPWYTPTSEDFVVQPGTAFTIGTLSSHIVDGIDNLFTMVRKRVHAWQANWAGKTDIVTKMLSGLKHDIIVLRRHPLTYRDIIIFVAQAQRSFLDIIAFMDYSGSKKCPNVCGFSCHLPHQYAYPQSRSPVRPQHSYARESVAVAGPSQTNNKDWVSPTEDEYDYDDY
jgi:hypothetical protein